MKLNIKKALLVIASVFVLVLVGFSVTNADASFTAGSVNFPAKHTDGSVKNLNAAGIAENLSGEGTYSVTYRITSNGEAVDFPLKTAVHKCPQGNGHTSTDGQRSPVCEEDGVAYNTTNVSLNAGNNYTQDVTISATQNYNKPCGSFQSDIFSNTPTPNANGFFYASVHFTGKDLGSCVPATSPTPTPTPTPTPSPSASPSTVQCPVGKVSKVVDSVIICVSQNQNQNQTQTQNNNQNQNVNQNVTANGGSSSSSSSSSSSVNLTVNNPTPAPSATTVVLTSNTTTTSPQVVMQTKGDVKELPKTGLPLAALALGGLMPAGFGLRKFGKSKTEEMSANSIWTEKQLQS